MKTHKLLVCGSRSWTDEDYIADILADYAPDDITVIHGGAPGADTMAADSAAFYGYDVIAFPADWRKHGRRAGILRNLEMLDQQPTKVIAFWDGQSRGTEHTLSVAADRGIPVEIHELVSTPDGGSYVMVSLSAAGTRT